MKGTQVLILMTTDGVGLYLVSLPWHNVVHVKFQALIRKYAPVAIVIGIVVMLFWVKNKIWWLVPSCDFTVIMLEPAELSCVPSCNHMFDRGPKKKRKMARWFIPHLPIQATTLAIKSKTTVVEIALELHISINWTCIIVLVSAHHVIVEIHPCVVTFF